MKKEPKLLKKHYTHVMLKTSEECNELAAELLKAVNKGINKSSLKKVQDEVLDVKKQLKLLDVILDDFNK